MKIDGVLERFDPAGEPVPLVFDSPHSGVVYPADFGFTAPEDVVRTAEDTHVDTLFAAAPAHGAPLLIAHVPRSYIDANRHVQDLDPELIDGAWPGKIAPGEKTKLGIGLVRRLAQPGIPMYDRRLSVAAIRHRIETCYLPYHDEPGRMIDALHGRFGAVWHINCHSMASRGSDITPDGDTVRADFVLGDRDGTTCSADFTAAVARFLGAKGYDVRINDPYKGAEIVRRYADPPARRHSLQIEINRALYMNEKTREPSSGFATLQSDLTELIRFLADFARASVG
jgi:N-formylglutamate amidohydrolase